MLRVFVQQNLAIFIQLYPVESWDLRAFMEATERAAGGTLLQKNNF